MEQPKDNSIPSPYQVDLTVNPMPYPPKIGGVVDEIIEKLNTELNIAKEKSKEFEQENDRFMTEIEPILQKYGIEKLFFAYFKQNSKITDMGITAMKGLTENNKIALKSLVEQLLKINTNEDEI